MQEMSSTSTSNECMKAAIASSIGAIVWTVFKIIASYQDQDPTALLSYWKIGYPVSILLSGLMGFCFPDRPWRWSVYIIYVQFVLGLLTTKGDWNLVGFGILFYALLTVPCIGFGYAGAWVSGKWRKRNIGGNSEFRGQDT